MGLIYVLFTVCCLIVVFSWSGLAVQLPPWGRGSRVLCFLLVQCVVDRRSLFTLPIGVIGRLCL